MPTSYYSNLTNSQAIAQLAQMGITFPAAK